MRYRLVIAFICLTTLLCGCSLPAAIDETEEVFSLLEEEETSEEKEAEGKEKASGSEDSTKEKKSREKDFSTTEEDPVPSYEEGETVRIDSVDELVSYAEYGISQGWSEADFTTVDLSEDNLSGINERLECFLGSVRRYTITSNKLSDKKKITIFFDISENYHVLKVLAGEEESEDPRVIQLAGECRRIFEQLKIDQLETDYSKERAFHDYLVRNVDYEKPENEEDAYNAYGALVSGKAVCNGYAQAMKLLLDLCGIENYMVSGTAGGEGHAWNLVSLDNAWYHVDVTWDDPTSNVPVSDVVKDNKIMFTYLNVTDEDMLADHEWDLSRYPAAQGTYYNYFTLNGLECDNYEEFRQVVTDLIRKEPGRQSLQVLVRNYDRSEYSEEAIQFIFEESQARHLRYFTSGPENRTGMYILLGYDG